MKSILTFGAAALALSIALPAAAQTAGSMTEKAPAAPPAATEPATPPATANTGAAADTSAATAALAVGLTVKDNTGHAIGQITQLKPDASGKQVATIKMGADTFAVDGANLAVQDGAAVVNATQAELQSMIKKSPAAKKPS
jgi:ABC-type oligopeptide transport system substrate-binding subunit